MKNTPSSAINQGPGPEAARSATVHSPEISLQGYVPHAELLSCIHCGLCTSACPTYLETGNENNSPRGRIHLMRGVEEGRIELNDKVQAHLDLCLDCRSCETACPSGVQYGQLIEQFRLSDRERKTASGEFRPDWFERLILQELFPSRDRLDRILWPAWLMQKLRLDRLIDKLGLVNLLPERLQRMHRMLPRLKKSVPRLPENTLPAELPAKTKVGLFLGCVADVMFRPVHWATLRMLQRAGCEVVIPNQQQCCGAIEYHSGQKQGAKQKAINNSRLFLNEKLDALIVNVAGCGAMLKEYHHLIDREDEQSDADALLALSLTTEDIHQFLARQALPVISQEFPLRVVYQDACHLRHAQQVETAPRQLLLKIPGLILLPIQEANICCGAAGSYNLQQPAMADALGKRKLEQILAQNPQVIASGNAGCTLHLQALLKQMGISLPIVHPVEILDAAYQGITADEFLKRAAGNGTA